MNGNKKQLTIESMDEDNENITGFTAEENYNDDTIPYTKRTGNHENRQISPNKPPLLSPEEKQRYKEILRQKLPELKQIEGFPIGDDEDILALSDPPYYTACPNPFIDEFIQKWQWEKHLQHHTEDLKNINDEPITQENFNPQECPLCIEIDREYKREPYTADISEGKNHPIYNAHSYHTKVPHKAIMRFILHYTEPGDIVFDGFCGTGMTGVACQLCGDRKAVEELGYIVDNQGIIYEPAEDTTEEKQILKQACPELVSRVRDDEQNVKIIAGKRLKPFSKLGVRKAVLNDLSPAATFIAYNYNTPVDVNEFEKEAKRILSEVEKECGWMYQTQHTFNGVVQKDQKANPIIGKINYTVWSDVFICPNCSEEIIFWNCAVDKEAGKVNDSFPCPNCKAELTKRTIERAWITKYDPYIKETIKQSKQTPVLINYTVPVSGKQKRFEKEPDQWDLDLIEKIEKTPIPYWFPTYRMPEGDESRRNDKLGITHVHQFYTKRNLFVLANLYNLSFNSFKKINLFFIQYASIGFCKLSRYVPTHFSQVNQYLSGTLYIGSQQVEVSPDYILSGKLQRLVSRELVNFVSNNTSIINNCTTSTLPIRKKYFDYIFTDPPFGGNLMYSELNFMWESWLKVFTNNKSEAVVNNSQQKGFNEYQKLMEGCFKEYYRVLKPGKWMTVEFSNTSSSIWNAIQEAIQRAGFVLANVSALDKKQGSFKAVTTTTAVKKDLIISAYKPWNGGEWNGNGLETANEETAWRFLNMHLKMLPIIKEEGDTGYIVEERTPRSLFDRMVAYHVQRGIPVPLSSAEFQEKAIEKYPERDGMLFLPEQVSIYERKRMNKNKFMQLSIFIQDEKSAIEWLRQKLFKKPQTYQDMVGEYMKEIQHIGKYEKMPELMDILEQNFLQYTQEDYDKNEPVSTQILSYFRKNYHDLREISADSPEILKKAKGVWYVPDPNKQIDLDKIREKTLWKEFSELLTEMRGGKKRFRQFRMESIRCGFKRLWDEKNYKTIIEVGERLPESVLTEDQELLMFYDNAVTRLTE